MIFRSRLGVSVLALVLLSLSPVAFSPRAAHGDAPQKVAFPANFKWCVATSAHQIEGGNANSDWWAWEQVAGHILNGDRSGQATDHWNRVDQDIALMSELGVTQYRLSIEWAKVEPKQGQWDLAVIEHYRSELAALKAAGIEPLVTLHHFTFPAWVSQKGGWEWDGLAPAFGRYARFVYEQVGAPADGVRDWITVNEPLVVLTGGYNDGIFPPGEKRPMSGLEKPLVGLLRAHAEAYAQMKSAAAAAGKSIRIGMAHHLRVYDSKEWYNPLDKWAAGVLDQAANWALVEALETGVLKLDVPYTISVTQPIAGLKQTQDFLGINYYSRDMVSVSVFSANKLERSVKSGAAVNDLGWEIYPEGMYRVVSEAAKRFPGKPILITENGTADAQDSERTQFLEDHLFQLSRAIAEGAPVEGYCHWSLIDNFEWANGFAPRFGLYDVDYSTYERTARPSAQRYGEIIRQNGFTTKN